MDIFADGGDFVDVLLHAADDGDERTQRHQHTAQNQQIFLSFHTILLLRSTSSMPSSRKHTGMTPIITTFSTVADDELMVR